MGCQITGQSTKYIVKPKYYQINGFSNCNIIGLTSATLTNRQAINYHSKGLPNEIIAKRAAKSTNRQVIVLPNDAPLAGGQKPESDDSKLPETTRASFTRATE